MAAPPPALGTQPEVISDLEEKDIGHDVINHVLEMADTFEKLLSEINEISEATDRKICKAEKNSAAQDIEEIGPFGYLDSACTLGVVTEEDQKYLVDTG